MYQWTYYYMKFKILFWKVKTLSSGGYLNIKMPSYKYRDSHYKGKTVSSLSYSYNENAHTWKDGGLYLKQGPTISEFICKFIPFFNSLWPSDTIWRHKSGSTLAQVMACCLAAPSHYLNQCWLIISKVQWYSSECNVTRDTSAISHWN